MSKYYIYHIGTVHNDYETCACQWQENDPVVCWSPNFYFEHTLSQALNELERARRVVAHPGEQDRLVEEFYRKYELYPVVPISVPGKEYAAALEQHQYWRGYVRPNRDSVVGEIVVGMEDRREHD